MTDDLDGADAALPVGTVEETVPAILAGERIDRVVAMITSASRSQVTAWITAGLVTVDGIVTTSRSAKLAEGSLVRAPRPAVVADKALEADPAVQVEVVYLDDDVIVVDKQAGVVVHPGSGQRTGTLVQGLLARFPDIVGVGEDPDRPGIVHRIDKDTSGLLMVARTAEAYDSLVSQLQARSVQRRYLALCWGHFDVRSGMVDGGIGRSRRDPTKMAVTATGKPARTHYDVMERFHHPVDVSLVACRLLSGRTHQIRVHMQSIGHPVVGDVSYGGSRQSLPLPRMFLHAATLGFVHPRTGEDLVFESPLPPDLTAALNTLS